jgi:hypothetical protein
VNEVFSETAHKHIDLLDLNITPYNYDGNYPEDDFNKLAEEILQHDILICNASLLVCNECSDEEAL